MEEHTLISIQEPDYSAVVVVARVCLGAVFLVSGIHKAMWYTKAAEEFEHAAVPLITFTLPLTIVLHIIASVCILGGVFVSEAALSLAAFTVLATLRVHRFWQLQGSEWLEQSRNALANLGLIGGLLLLAASGPGRFSLF